MKVFKMGMIGLVAVGLLLAASAQGAVITVNWAAAGAAIEANNVPLTQGDLVQIGTMSGASNNLANFTPWASGAVGDSFSLPGVFSESSTLDEGTVSHTQIYMVCYGNTVADSANYGIFAGFNDPNWIFPASSDSSTVAIDLGDASVQIIAGSTGVNDDVFGDGSFVIPGKNILGIDTQAAAVPEPSSLMLAAVGLLGMVSLFRRRS